MSKIDNELLEIQRRFKEYYKENLKHKYEELEQIRRKYLWKFLGAIFLLAIGVYFFVFIEKNYKGYVFLALTVLFLFLAGKVYCYFADEYKQDTKGVVWNKILPFWLDFKKGDYRNPGITRQKIDDSLLFGNFDELHADDCFCGFYKNVQVAVAELKLFSKEKFTNIPSYISDFLRSPIWFLVGLLGEKEKIEYNNMLFSGLLINIKTDKIFNQETIVCENDYDVSHLKNNWKNFFMLFLSFGVFVISSLFFYAINKINCDSWQLLGVVFLCFKWCVLGVVLFCLYYFCCYLFGWWKTSFTYHDEMGQVNLEDVVFSKKWNVVADDQVEARYVLTPALMERMLAVKKLFHGNRLDFSFFGNNLLIAVHTTKDMFETTSLFKSALDYRKVQEVICQLYSIFSVIDVLKLQNESKKG